MNIEKLIFLDFDGVITTRKTRYSYFDHDCMKHLKAITDATGAFIVVTSTWRMGESMRLLKALFEPFGMYDNVIDKTPINHAKFRGGEIEQWIKHSHWAEHLNLKSFVILDDDSDMIPYMDRLINTHISDTEAYLTAEHAQKAIDMLNND